MLKSHLLLFVHCVSVHRRRGELHIVSDPTVAVASLACLMFESSQATAIILPLRLKLTALTVKASSAYGCVLCTVTSSRGICKKKHHHPTPVCVRCLWKLLMAMRCLVVPGRPTMTHWHAHTHAWRNASDRCQPQDTLGYYRLTSESYDCSKYSSINRKHFVLNALGIFSGVKKGKLAVCLIFWFEFSIYARWLDWLPDRNPLWGLLVFHVSVGENPCYGDWCFG